LVGCPNLAGEDPVPNLVDVPDSPSDDEDDGPVFLCPEHRAAYDHARDFKPTVMSFLIGLNAQLERDR
jgi:hypothetical protein